MRPMRAVFALLPLLWLTVFAPRADAAGLAFVMNSGGASVSLIDMATHKELRRIPALREPHHWALTPDGKSLLVGDTVGNELLAPRSRHRRAATDAFPASIRINCGSARTESFWWSTASPATRSTSTTPPPSSW